MSYFRKLAAAVTPSNPSGTYIGQIPQIENDPKFAGAVTNASEFNQPVKPYVETPQEATRRQQAAASPQGLRDPGYAAPIVGRIDNRAYAQQPYKQKLDFDKINASRAQKGALLPVQDGVNVVQYTGNGPNANAMHYSVEGTNRWVVQDSPGYTEAGFQKKDRMSPAIVRANGMQGAFMPSARSTASHEENHINNLPTKGYVLQAAYDQLVNPGFSNRTYAYNPAEAIQSLASRKRSEAANGHDVSTPRAMEESLGRLATQNDPVLGEEYRLRNYLRTSMKDYNDTSEVGPYHPIKTPLPKVSTPYRIGEPQGHPIFRNISNTYREAIPDLVQNRQPGRMDKVASTPNSSYNQFMNPDRLTKIAAILQKATDDLKSSDRPAGKRVQPPRVMSTSTSAELIQQKRESEGDMQAKQASRATGRLFRLLVG